MRDPKILIRKRRQLDDAGHYRFYRVRDGNGMIVPAIPLDNHPQIQTERHLLKMILDTWGEGEYLINGTAKGRKGFFVFWRGMVEKNGYLFYKKEYDRRAVAEWDDILDSKDEDDNALLQNVVEEEKKKKFKQRYGFLPFLKASGRRGQMNFWNDKSFERSQDSEEESSETDRDWGSPREKDDGNWTPKVRKPESWGANKVEESQW